MTPRRSPDPPQERHPRSSPSEDAKGIATLRVTPRDLDAGAVALAATLAQALVRGA